MCILYTIIFKCVPNTTQLISTYKHGQLVALNNLGMTGSVLREALICAGLYLANVMS